MDEFEDTTFRSRAAHFLADVPLREIAAQGLPVIASIVAGTSLLTVADSTLAKLGAGLIVAMGAIGMVGFAASERWHGRSEAEEGDKVELRVRAQMMRRRKNRAFLRAARIPVPYHVPRPQPKPVETATVEGSNFAAHAAVFYGGLFAGLAGAAVAISGLVRDAYPSTLAGGILASIGFVTLTCALISAEALDDETA